MREPNRAVFFLVVPALVGAASALWALVISYPKGPAGNPDWPAGLRELANSDATTRDWINDTDNARLLRNFMEMKRSDPAK